MRFSLNPVELGSGTARNNTGGVSEFEMMWETSGLHRMRLEVSDSEGASSGTYERWVSVANVPPVVQPLEEVLPLAEGEEVRLVGC